MPDTLQERQSHPTTGSPIRKRKAEAAAAARAAEHSPQLKKQLNDDLPVRTRKNRAGTY